jgi:predicted nuclease with RNAse H fold
MTTVGIDVGGVRKGFHLVALEGSSISGVLRTRSVDEVVAWCLSQEATLVSIDAPCRWRPQSGNRLAERELYRRGISCYWTPAREAAILHPKNFYGWMLNGMALYDALAGDFPLITDPTAPLTSRSFETFPHAVSRQLRGPEADKQAQRRSILAACEVQEKSLTSIDFVDAALCALTAQLMLKGQTIALGDEAGGWMMIPRSDTNPTRLT